MIGRVRADCFSPITAVQGNLYVSRSIGQFELSVFVHEPGDVSHSRFD
jgi:hypothetical protein